MDKSMIKTINKDFKRILVLQGGGARGKITSVLIRQIQKLLGGPICQKVDLIVCNSTGSVQGSFLGYGVPAQFIDQMYLSKMGSMFVPMPWYKRLLSKSRPKYQQRLRAKFVRDIFRQKFGLIPYFGQTKTNIAMMAYNRVSKRTHVFMSWDYRHIGQKIIDSNPPYGVLRWSALDATLYFGPIVNARYKWWQDFQVPQPQWMYGRVFKDGGEGLNNSPIRQAVAKASRMGWAEKQLRILALGCGEQLLKGDFNKQRNDWIFGQVKDYRMQARDQAMYNQLKLSQDFCSGLKSRYIKRISPILPQRLDVLDGVQFVKEYDQIGHSLVSQIPEWFYK